MFQTVPSTITPTGPIDDTHGNTDESDFYLDDLDIKPNTIAAMPPPAKVSTLVVMCPISEIGPG